MLTSILSIFDQLKLAVRDKTDTYPFSTNVSLLYPLETSENFRFSDVLRRYRSGTLVENGLSDNSNQTRIKVSSISN